MISMFEKICYVYSKKEIDNGLSKPRSEQKNSSDVAISSVKQVGSNGGNINGKIETEEKLNNNEKTKHEKIIKDIEEMSSIKNIYEYLVRYIGYKDDVFRTMLVKAYDIVQLGNDNVGNSSNKEVKEFVEEYKIEVSRQKAKEYINARKNLFDNINQE